MHTPPTDDPYSRPILEIEDEVTQIWSVVGSSSIPISYLFSALVAQLGGCHGRRHCEGRGRCHLHRGPYRALLRACPCQRGHHLPLPGILCPPTPPPPSLPPAAVPQPSPGPAEESPWISKTLRVKSVRPRRERPSPARLHPELE
jgi:hypothetical protein